MADTRFITSVDGARIAYHVCGAGPAVVLLHGFENTRQQWHEQGWVERLRTDYTVMTVDLRGCGESGVSSDPAYYAPAAHLADLHAIADACGAARFALVGFSWGATVARHMVAHSDRVNRGVLISAYFGDYFTETFLAAQMEYYKHDRILAARIQGLRAWPGIEPEALRAPTLVITGTQDGAVVDALKKQRQAMEATGVVLEVFEGPDHAGLIEAVDIVLPRVQAFLRHLTPKSKHKTGAISSRI
jgi:pimeloyl-ACP methyl ester carboxylesterase